jgi:hypothetical protein
MAPIGRENNGTNRAHSPVGGGGDLGFIGAGVWEGLEGVQPLA